MSICNLKQHPEHLQTIAAWHHAEWENLNPGQTLDQRIEKMQLYLNEKIIPTTLIYLEGDTICGSAAIIESDMDTHEDLSPWLASVFVAPKYRRQGIGRKLVEAMMQLAENSGYAPLYLFTPSEERFYKQIGWQTVTKENYRGEAVTVMKVGSSLNESQSRRSQK